MRAGPARPQGRQLWSGSSVRRRWKSTTAPHTVPWKVERNPAILLLISASYLPAYLPASNHPRPCLGPPSSLRHSRSPSYLPPSHSRKPFEISDPTHQTRPSRLHRHRLIWVADSRFRHYRLVNIPRDRARASKQSTPQSRRPSASVFTPQTYLPSSSPRHLGKLKS